MNTKHPVHLKISVFLLSSLLLFSGCTTGKDGDSTATGDGTGIVTEAADTTPAAEEITLSIREINKHGNVIPETTFAALKEVNIEVGDIVTVFIGEASYDMPVCTEYSDVDTGTMLFRYDLEDSKAIFAVNGGSFAETVDMAAKQTVEEDPGYRWEMKTDTLRLLLKEKGGYLDEYTARHLVRTNEREDYAGLSDEEFANFREVATAGIRSGVLYRGTTPLNDSMGRSTYVMTAMEKYGIRSVLNLADTEAEMKAFPVYEGSYYAGCSVANVLMSYDFTSEAFAGKVKDCVKFILSAETPVYIHCKEGKDRTGILCALLECYMGASYEEVRDDYMKTYLNFYQIEENSETYRIVLEKSLEKVLDDMFGIGELQSADLKKEAGEYLLSAGLTDGELAALSEKIGA